MAQVRTVIKRGGLILGLTLGAVGICLAWNLVGLTSIQMDVDPAPPLELDEQAILERFQEAIRIPTLSSTLARLEPQASAYRFRDFLHEKFPDLHQSPWQYYTGADFGDPAIPSILLKWPGTNPDRDAVLLMSHFDVVPVERAAWDKWQYGPFDGHIDEEYVWGRGSLDCKHGVMAILEAMSRLTSEGYQPERTIYVALGHDEEIGGYDGNRKMAEWLRSRRQKLHLVLDEGGCIYLDFPGLNKPAALIGVAEKGALNIQLSVDVSASDVGHGSMPPRETAVGILASAVARVQARPFPAKMQGALRETFRYLGPEMDSFFSRLAVANLWLCEALVTRQLAAKPSSDALLRTTIAPTVISGGVGKNVLPQHAEANVNLRLLPGQSVDEAIDYIRRSVDDSRVVIEADPGGKPASSVTRTDSEAFKQIHRTVREVYPDTVVAPILLVGSTDSVHYADLCDNILRFIPARLTERDTQRFHGIDERLSKQDYLQIVRFFYRFVQNVTQSGEMR